MPKTLQEFISDAEEAAKSARCELLRLAYIDVSKKGITDDVIAEACRKFADAHERVTLLKQIKDDWAESIVWSTLASRGGEVYAIDTLREICKWEVKIK